MEKGLGNGLVDVLWDDLEGGVVFRPLFPALGLIFHFPLHPGLGYVIFYEGCDEEVEVAHFLGDIEVAEVFGWFLPLRVGRTLRRFFVVFHWVGEGLVHL